jgi:hypothetical protein
VIVNWYDCELDCQCKMLVATDCHYTATRDEELVEGTDPCHYISSNLIIMSLLNTEGTRRAGSNFFGLGSRHVTL